ncbi:LuxR C-terminal-related transcriptional regulator [Piscinibacter gummiphilus]|uniref:Uncharacterized protein n=1 Tax=Piscinibacter gummiphilus TaxID=946333 RepID=A0A1W6L7S5_9BURK|nr:LuxR C-terminal-related transcriptional regulator [Piscinibacter gummiphilus]ARN20198.1 hypothetical protein A4W93_09950 [Piscinibacter gummiphilus]ATU64868.1 transcriptional regulator [Piscinibacter gummiphilus]GLS96506.1 hypothetical protein GCM10007918_37980 [Piscinibacter gummiphilus]
MSAPFALTKIQPPRLRPGLIARPLLEGQLAVALGTARLVLVSAPAGFGKTAAITRQLALLPEGTAVAWIAADPDDDLTRVAACLVAALDPYDLPWRTSPDALVAAQDGTRPPRQALVAELLNALASAEVPAGVIVLDDAHRIEDPAVFEFLDALVGQMPPNWCVLVASRSDPPLALAKLRALGDLAEVRQEQLRFGHEEIHALARTASRDVTDAEVRALTDRTQGWAVGLRLALSQSLQAAGGPGGNLRDRHVFDYLASEVLGGLDPDLRTFLLRCAVLPVLSPSRCAVVSGDPLAARRLDEVERRGLFVSVRGADGAGETTLCLHDLFRDFLEDRLQAEHADELPALLRRAADTEPDPAHRVAWLTRAGAWDEAEAVLYQLGPSMLASGAVLPLRRLLAQFPADRRERSARLNHLLGLCAWAHWDLLPMCAALERAATLHATEDRPADAQRALVLLVLGMTAGGVLARSAALLEPLRRRPLDAWVEAVAHQADSWHALAHSRMHSVAPALERMMDLLETQDDPALWLQCVPLASFVGLPGVAGPVRRYIDGALRRTVPDTPSPLRVLAMALQGALQLWQGDTATALDTLRSVEDDCRWLNNPPNLSGYLGSFSALALAVSGEHGAALAAARTGLTSLDDDRTSGRRTVWLGHMTFFHARVAGMLDDDESFRTIAAQLAAHHNPDEREIFLRERATLPARLAALDGDWPRAAALYAGALVDEEALEMYGQAVEVRVRFVQALLMNGQVRDAALALRPVFDRVAADGEAGAVRFAGPRALRTVANADWKGLMSLEDIARLRRWAGQPDRAAATPMAHTLSARERDVLARMAAGDSNKLIARAFDLSPHTVKRHVANILDKLQVASRGQAAARYLETPSSHVWKNPGDDARQSG